MFQQNWSCLRLLRQAVLKAFCLDLERAGSNREARMAMMATTTSKSINVNATIAHGNENGVPPPLPLDCRSVLISTPALPGSESYGQLMLSKRHQIEQMNCIAGQLPTPA